MTRSRLRTRLKGQNNEQRRQDRSFNWFASRDFRSHRNHFPGREPPKSNLPNRSKLIERKNYQQTNLMNHKDTQTKSFEEIL